MRARVVFLLFAMALCGFGGEPDRPNIVLIFADDLGYGDLGCYGSRNRTPNLDRMAKQGLRFTQFYVGQAVCSASRAALLTGCYPNRVGVQGAFSPRSKNALHTNEVTLAELLKARGYATACFGKWHLGDRPEFLPTRQGFDEYYGLPYSNDMWPFHPTGGTNYPPLPLIENERVIQLMPDQTQLTKDCTARGVEFIRRHKNEPFFLYLPYNMPHVPLHVSKRFEGKSGRGLYADVIAELDWAVGEVLQTLKRLKLEEQTLVIFTSDNGPWLSYGDHAGSSGGLREGKGTVFEGGMRVPCLMKWPGKIPAGKVSDGMAGTIDLLPTLAALTKAELPGVQLDGKNIWPLIRGEKGRQSPREEYLFYWGRELQAIRSGEWKLHFPHTYPSPEPPGNGGKPGKIATKRIELSLFNLAKDPKESRNVIADHPEVVARLTSLAEQARNDLGDSLQTQRGRNTRPPGKQEPGEI